MISIFTTIFGYAVGGTLLLFCLILLILESLLPKRRIFEPIIKLGCRIIPATFFFRVKVLGRTKLDPQKTYLFMANHVNVFDGVLLYGYIRQRCTGVELESHFRYPLWGTVIKRMGVIPISHKSIESALRSLKIAADTVNNGTSIIILPEGHRSRDGNLGDFMRGPFRLALETKVDIVPIVFHDAEKIKRYKQKLIKPGKMAMEFGEPIRYENFASLNDKALRDTVREKIVKMLENKPVY